MTPPIPDGRCPHCNGPILDLFAEWTDDYETEEGKRAILAGDIVFDCYFCQQPMQLCLPLDLIVPEKQPGQYRVAKRRKTKCEEWLARQHPASPWRKLSKAQDCGTTASGRSTAIIGNEGFEQSLE